MPKGLKVSSKKNLLLFDNFLLIPLNALSFLSIFSLRCRDGLVGMPSGLGKTLKLLLEPVPGSGIAMFGGGTGFSSSWKKQNTK